MKFSERRQVDTVIISDVHLGTYGCHATELLSYLRSVAPQRLILNGDIIDGWQFSRSYFPTDHIKVVRELLKFLSKGVEVWYIAGNHDEFMRRFVGQELANLHIDNKVILDLDGRKAWVFHGDVFDVSMRHSRLVARIGGHGYDLLILFNRAVNQVLLRLGREKISLSKRIKDSVKAAVRFIDDYEDTAVRLGLDQGYDYVVCGHIHRPCVKEVNRDGRTITYLNSGDWVENLTALEFEAGRWTLYRYADDKALHTDDTDDESADGLTSKEIFINLSKEFRLHTA
jgi:UDP-2,3-diacylglucosamine pyrophosphatase LpxH